MLIKYLYLCCDFILKYIGLYSYGLYLYFYKCNVKFFRFKCGDKMICKNYLLCVWYNCFVVN